MQFLPFLRKNATSIRIYKALLKDASSKTMINLSYSIFAAILQYGIDDIREEAEKISGQNKETLYKTLLNIFHVPDLSDNEILSFLIEFGKKMQKFSDSADWGNELLAIPVEHRMYYLYLTRSHDPDLSYPRFISRAIVAYNKIFKKMWEFVDLSKPDETANAEVYKSTDEMLADIIYYYLTTGKKKILRNPKLVASSSSSEFSGFSSKKKKEEKKDIPNEYQTEYKEEENSADPDDSEEYEYVY